MSRFLVSTAAFLVAVLTLSVYIHWVLGQVITSGPAYVVLSLLFMILLSGSVTYGLAMLTDFKTWWISGLIRQVKQEVERQLPELLAYEDQRLHLLNAAYYVSAVRDTGSVFGPNHGIR